MFVVAFRTFLFIACSDCSTFYTFLLARKPYNFFRQHQHSSVWPYVKQPAPVPPYFLLVSSLNRIYYNFRTVKQHWRKAPDEVGAAHHHQSLRHKQNTHTPNILKSFWVCWHHRNPPLFSSFPLEIRLLWFICDVRRGSVTTIKYTRWHWRPKGK